MKLQTKFTLSLLAVTSIIILLATYFSYKTAESEAQNDAYKTCFRILSSVEASRTFVRETLRPVIKKIVEKKEFIPEAMSASFVARNQFENFLKDYPSYHVKFASVNPRNPINLADKIETDIITRFGENPDLKEWHGVTNRNNAKFYTVAKPFRFKKNCMTCHSDPKIAPRPIVESYGDVKGFWRQIGDVTMYSISVPIEVTYSEIWRHTILFVVPIVSLIFLTLLISSQLFKRMISKPLINFSDGIEKFSMGNYQVTIDEQNSGELKNLAETFNAMTTKLLESDKIRKHAEEELQKAHNQLEQKVEERTSELLIANDELIQEIKQREKAESEIKILGGLLPICSHCKKIRDDKGYWKQLENYIQEKSEAKFSHGICEECVEKHYPDCDLSDE